MPLELADGLGTLALFAVPGYALTELVPDLRRLPPPRRAAYGYLLGITAIAGGLYALSHLFAVPLRAPAVWSLAALSCAAGLAAALLRAARSARAARSTKAARARQGEPDAPAGPGAPPPLHAAAWPDEPAPAPAPVTARPRRDALTLAAQAAAVAIAAWVFAGLAFEAVSQPIHDWDGRMTWSAQARYVRAAGTVDAPALRDKRVYITHPQYPLLLPLAQVAALEAWREGPASSGRSKPAGGSDSPDRSDRSSRADSSNSADSANSADLVDRADSQFQRILYAAFFPVFLLLVYDGAQRPAGRRAAALIVLAAATVPFFAYGQGGAFTTYSDLPLACFYGAAVNLLLAARPALSGGLAAGLLLAAAVLTKNEGLLLAPFALLITWRGCASTPAAGRRLARFASTARLAPPDRLAPPAQLAPAAWLAWPARLAQLARLTITAVPLLLALALLFSWRAGIPNREDDSYPELLRSGALWPGLLHHPAAFVPVLVQQMALFRQWDGFWFLVPVLFALGRRCLRHPLVRRRLLLAAAPAVIAWAAYSIHPRAAYLASVTWDRFLLQASVPLLAALAAALAAAFAIGSPASAPLSPVAPAARMTSMTRGPASGPDKELD